MGPSLKGAEDIPYLHWLTHTTHTYTHTHPVFKRKLWVKNTNKEVTSIQMEAKGMDKVLKESTKEQNSRSQYKKMGNTCN